MVYYSWLNLSPFCLVHTIARQAGIRNYSLSRHTTPNWWWALPRHHRLSSFFSCLFFLFFLYLPSWICYKVKTCRLYTDAHTQTRAPHKRKWKREKKNSKPLRDELATTKRHCFFFTKQDTREEYAVYCCSMGEWGQPTSRAHTHTISLTLAARRFTHYDYE